LKRLPIRVRLTLAFTGSMAAVLLATGAFLYIRVGDALDHNIREGLETRSAEIAELARRGSPLENAVIPDDREDQFAQLLTTSGRVVDESSSTVGSPLVGASDLGLARAGMTVWIDRTTVSGVNGPVRVMARRTDTGDGPLVLAVGVSLTERDDAVRRLLGELFIVGPGALLVASMIGYWLAAAALGPVEAMRSEAAAISANEPGRRLPLPAPHDEIRRLGETLNSTFDRLEEALTHERAFVANASHELRSPVSRLNAELELALRHPRSTAELEQAIRAASADARLLAGLADNLLLLARSDHGRLRRERVTLDVTGMLSTVAARFAADAAIADRRIETSAPEGLELVGDSLQLEQALGNAVSNALRHGDGTIELRAIEREDVVELHVLDAGAGVPAEFLPRAFARFSQADDAHGSEGTGLGLAIIDAIATAHGGSAHLDNRPAGGADLWMALPREPHSAR
jgi:signal transduction histidine kinase